MSTSASSARRHVKEPWVESDLLENCTEIAELVKNAGEMVPFPFIKSSVGVGLEVLRVIKKAKENREELRDLVGNLVHMVVGMRDALLENYDTPRGGRVPYSVTQCQDYIQKLLKMLTSINETIRKTPWWAWYLTTGCVRKRIEKCRSVVEELRSNITLLLVVNINFLVSRPQGNLKELTVRLIDATDRHVDLPFVLFRSFEDFHEHLKIIYRERRGRNYIENQQYDLTESSCVVAYEPLNSRDWRSKVRPGTTIIMNILLERSADDRACPNPTCGLPCHEASPLDSTSTSCGTRFWVSRATIEELPVDSTEVPGSSNQNVNLTSHVTTPFSTAGTLDTLQNNEDALDISDFRRFHILEEVVTKIEDVVKEDIHHEEHKKTVDVLRSELEEEKLHREKLEMMSRQDREAREESDRRSQDLLSRLQQLERRVSRRAIVDPAELARQQVLSGELFERRPPRRRETPPPTVERDDESCLHRTRTRFLPMITILQYVNQALSAFR